MSEIIAKVKMIQEVFTKQMEKNEWPEMIKIINDKYFYRAIYYSLVKSYSNQKNIPALSEILNPFKQLKQNDLKIMT